MDHDVHESFGASCEIRQSSSWVDRREGGGGEGEGEERRGEDKVEHGNVPRVPFTAFSPLFRVSLSSLTPHSLLVRYHYFRLLDDESLRDHYCELRD